MARVATHLSVSELEREYRVAKAATAARHYQAIWLLARGHTVPEVVEMTSFGTRWLVVSDSWWKLVFGVAPDHDRLLNQAARSIGCLTGAWSSVWPAGFSGSTRAHQGIAALADPAMIVDLPRAVFSRRRADRRRHI